MSLRSRLLISGIALLAAPTTPAQAPSQPPPRVASVRLSPPDVELGELVRDDEWGFEFRLPKGFSPLAADELAKRREQMLAPPDDEDDEAGVRKRVQLWQWVGDEGRSITLLGHEPPLAIETPLQLRTKISEQDLIKGRKVEDFGKLYEFGARGGLTGFLVSRRFGIEPHKAPELAEHVAYVRGARRSFLLRYVAPLASFDGRSPDFLAAVTTFALFGDADVPIVPKLPPKRAKAASARTIATALLALVALVGTVVYWRRSPSS